MSKYSDKGMKVTRHFTTAGVSPYDAIEWGFRTPEIKDWKTGKVVFRQENVEAPVSWSDQAVQIVASKYFYGDKDKLGLPVSQGGRETSVRQIVARVADTITGWGGQDGYFASAEDEQAFNDELTHMLLNQVGAFNSPVWFNVGMHQKYGTKGPKNGWRYDRDLGYAVEVQDAYEHPQGSACLPYEGLVNTDRGLIPIGDIVQLVKQGDIIHTYDKDGEPTRIVAAKCNGKKWVNYYHMDDGSSLAMTGDHVVFVIGENGSLVEKQADDLKPKDRLVLTRNDIIPKTIGYISAGNLFVTPELAWISGLMVGDGYCDHPTSACSDIWEIKLNTDSELDRVKTILNDYEVPYSVTPKHWGCIVRGYGAPGRAFWERLGLWGKTNNKIIPDWVMSSGIDLVAPFISGLFDSDGTVTYAPGERVYVAFSNTSSQIVERLQILLRSLGIYSSITEYRDPREDYRRKVSYTVNISDQVSVDNFAKKIGFTHEKKIDRIDGRREDVDYQRCRQDFVSFVEKRRHGVAYVYDIQTESGTFWYQGILVHNCFLQSVEDNMNSIMDLAKSEAMLFKFGSGTGTDLSTLRSTREKLSGGGKPSGPVSFFKVYDTVAGIIKSGGVVRRAARMQTLCDWHPDVLEFAESKLNEERKARALIDAGYDSDFNGEAYSSVAFQNTNISIRLSDMFMKAVENNDQWTTKAVTDGRDIETWPAARLMDAIAYGTWFCGDPGVQFEDEIQRWHTVPNDGRISTSNPCLRKGTRLLTDQGYLNIEDMASSYDSPTMFNIFDGTKYFTGHVWLTGKKKCVRIHTRGHETIDVTPDHLFFTSTISGPSFDSLAEAKDCKGRAIYVYCEGDEGQWVSHPVECIDVECLEGDFDVYDFRVPTTSMGVANGFYVSNCSEFLHLDETACNLAAINLLKFRNDDGTFDTESFRHVCDILITSQEIIVGNASYPTKLIAEKSYRYRPLGLGYANLGALIMAQGFAYDSEQGRDLAAAVTALMLGQAYIRSSLHAKNLGSFEGFERNRKEMLHVIRMHGDYSKLDYNKDIDRPDYLTEMWCDAHNAFLECEELGGIYGFRNSQAVVLMPTGTCAFMMDCTTTGPEPAIALVSYKKLAGGGSMKLANNIVQLGLKTLGYTSEDIKEITDHIAEHDTIEGSFLDDRHLPVFDCAFRAANGTRSIHYKGHIDMIAAVQPYLSGSASKTTNLPESATVEEIKQAYIYAWKKGLKCVAIYRDNSKGSQPLNVKADTDKKINPTETDRLNSEIKRLQGELDRQKPGRKKLPSTRQAIVHKFEFAQHEGYITAGMYDDGQLAEVFIVMSKEGSTLAGLMDALGISISLGLQHGTPLSTFVDKFSYTNFAPSGITRNPEIPFTNSIVDYLGRWLDIEFPGGYRKNHKASLESVQKTVSEVRAAVEPVKPLKPAAGKICGTCGGMMVQVSSRCHSCPNCGDGSGGCGG